jgi:hypothetical protein
MNLGSALSRVIDRVPISRCEPVGGRYVKTRQGLGWVVALGNVYMRWAGARIAMFPRAAGWQRHEFQALRLVHPALAVEERPGGGITMDPLPGEPLRSIAARGALTGRAIAAAGRELRRCHALAGGTFAHGDPHLANLLFDEATGRASLIDFETIYLPSVPVDLRRANDLLVVVLELLARAPDDRWPRWPLALVEGYEDPTITRILCADLRPPRGLGRVLWASRTGRRPWALVAARLASLRAALLSPAAGAR